MGLLRERGGWVKEEHMAEGTCGIVGFESSKRPLLPVRPAVIEGHLLQIRREREREREREEERERERERKSGGCQR